VQDLVNGAVSTHNPFMDRRQTAIVVGLVGLVLVLVALSRGGDSVDRTEAPSLIEQARERQAEPAAVRRARGERPVATYTKREGLHIDIPYLSGRRLNEVPPAVVKDQLGELVSREELPEDEEHLVYEKAEIWIYDGRLYRIRKLLAHPMDMSTALGTSGFPLDLGVPIDATVEVRWNHVWNQRRLRLLKNQGDGRTYDVIDSVKFLPKELL
jgi:hypothetical protein